ncbi:TerC family protein [Neokomagataea tanensis]|uniref:TerC family protein n=2 Tax=Neokomagataea TaxID=1223423 RepID=A0A4Y6VAS9_9PROT|nr:MULTISPECIES: YjbE family putative metal transport protein [Neokomagataea]QDH25626.1 TerC family protein [Neokomagataea tanensis]
MIHTLFALAQVTLIDVTLAGDNAVVIGLAVRQLTGRDRTRAIFAGTLLSAVLRIVLALVAVQLLSIVGLTLAGGLLLLWVCARMFHEFRHEQSGPTIDAPSSLKTAIVRIIAADLSMSVDNVLAVAGAAVGHPWVLVFGLVASVLMMALAASFIARLLERYKWIAWVGLAIVLFVAVELIVKGGGEVWQHVVY